MVIKNPELLFVDKGEQIFNVESIDSQGQYSFGLRFASFYLDINTSAYVPIIKVHINKKEQGRAHVIKTKRIVVRNLDFKTALCDAINTVFKYDPFKRNDETIKIAALDWALREETSEQFITQLYNYIHELDAKDARNKGVMLCDQIYNSTKTISPRGIAFSTNSKTGSIVLKIPPSMAIQGQPSTISSRSLYELWRSTAIFVAQAFSTKYVSPSYRLTYILNVYISFKYIRTEELYNTKLFGSKKDIDSQLSTDEYSLNTFIENIKQQERRLKAES